MARNRNKPLTKGGERFMFFLDILDKLIRKSASQENPSLWLYQNDARKTTFMLEALAKLYARLHNRKKFTQLRKKMKALEDGLGVIDYYEVLVKEFAGNQNVPHKVIGYLEGQTIKKTKELNRLLKQKWTPDDIKKIRKSVSEAKWTDEEPEVNKIKSFYEKEIQKIIIFTYSSGYHFNSLEKDVHELRRRLRWLSIYATALQGCVQLSSKGETPAHLHKYLTKDIIESPFNKLPDANDCSWFLLLDKDCFYALSWLIAELGKLKDEGLKIIAIREAIAETEGIIEEKAMDEAYSILGKDQPRMEELLKTCANLCKTFFKEMILNNLVIGTECVSREQEVI